MHCVTAFVDVLHSIAFNCVHCGVFELKITVFDVFVFIRVNSYWAQGLKPPPTFMIMGLAYMTSPPTFVT